MISNTANKIPPIDFFAPPKTDLAIFSMGCFWGADSFFGSVVGVVRTRVGYAGGSTPNPTYEDIGDHIETVQIDFDPEVISYEELLGHYLSQNHLSRTMWKRQYASAIFYRSEEQQNSIAEKLLELSTEQKDFPIEVYPYKTIHLAEDRHQKYYLQQHPELMDEFKDMYFSFCDFVNSTAAARINGFLGGNGTRALLDKEIHRYGLSPKAKQDLLSLADSLDLKAR